jgi:hypothetical protein
MHRMAISKSHTNPFNKPVELAPKKYSRPYTRFSNAFCTTSPFGTSFKPFEYVGQVLE